MLRLNLRSNFGHLFNSDMKIHTINQLESDQPNPYSLIDYLLLLYGVKIYLKSNFAIILNLIIKITIIINNIARIIIYTRLFAKTTNYKVLIWVAKSIIAIIMIIRLSMNRKELSSLLCKTAYCCGKSHRILIRKKSITFIIIYLCTLIIECSIDTSTWLSEGTVKWWKDYDIVLQEATFIHHLIAAIDVFSYSIQISCCYPAIIVFYGFIYSTINITNEAYNEVGESLMDQLNFLLNLMIN